MFKASRKGPGISIHPYPGMKEGNIIGKFIK
jgi:hypothetical protein